MRISSFLYIMMGAILAPLAYFIVFALVFSNGEASGQSYSISDVVFLYSYVFVLGGFIVTIVQVVTGGLVGWGIFVLTHQKENLISSWKRVAALIFVIIGIVINGYMIIIAAV